MTRAALIGYLRKHSRAVRLVAAQRDVGPGAEQSLRIVAAAIDELRMEVMAGPVEERERAAK